MNNQQDKLSTRVRILLGLWLAFATIVTAVSAYNAGRGR